MWNFLQNQNWDGMTVLVLVPTALILAMVLAGIYNSIHR
jgi:hypothetical protein